MNAAPVLVFWLQVLQIIYASSARSPLEVFHASDAGSALVFVMASPADHPERPYSADVLDDILYKAWGPWCGRPLE